MTVDRADAGESPPRRRRGVSLVTRIAATVLGVGLASLTAAMLVGITAAQSVGEQIVDESVGALRASGSGDVVGYLQYYKRIAEQLGGSPQAGLAIEEFSAAVDELPLAGENELRTQRLSLLEVYRERYLAPSAATGQEVDITDLVPQDAAAVYLQSAYSLPLDADTEPIAIRDAVDGSTWSQVHDRVHPSYRTAVRQAGLLDIYLVDADGERVVYSAAKGPVLGRSLAVGPFSGSIVARAASAALESEEGIMSDLGFYAATPGRPIGAAAAPVRDGSAVVGAVVVTYDGEIYSQRLASLVDSGADPERDSLYLIGADGTTRSDPQAYLADPDAFLDASAAAGVLTGEAQATIELRGTTVLAQPATDATVNAALDGETEVALRTSMTGVDVFATVERVPVEDVEWYIVAEADAEAAGGLVASFRQILLVGTAVFVVALAFAAVSFANRFMQPVRVISDRLSREVLATDPAVEPEPVEVGARTPVEYRRLAESFVAMGRSLRRQMLELRQARAARLDTLESMLPPSVAQRVARGEIDSTEEVPSATVAVVVVLGLGALVHDDPTSAARRLVDELHAEIDGIAADHGLDRIKVVGDSYFGVCGSDRPYIDHASRAVAFAEQVSAAVRGIGRTSSVPLDTAIGINTGPVMIGMSGGTRLVYDVWGPTVTVAHDLARSADAGTIVITDAARARLPDDTNVTPWRADMPGAAGHMPQPTGGLWALTLPGADERSMAPEAGR